LQADRYRGRLQHTAAGMPGCPGAGAKHPTKPCTTIFARRIQMEHLYRMIPYPLGRPRAMLRLVLKASWAAVGIYRAARSAPMSPRFRGIYGSLTRQLALESTRPHFSTRISLYPSLSLCLPSSCGGSSRKNRSPLFRRCRCHVRLRLIEARIQLGSG